MIKVLETNTKNKQLKDLHLYKDVGLPTYLLKRQPAFHAYVDEVMDLLRLRRETTV